MLFVLAAISAAALASDDHLIRHQYDEQAAAVNTDNGKRLFATMDPSFTQVDQNGKTLNFAAYKKGLEPMFTAIKSATIKFTLGPIKYAHGTATVDYSVDGVLTVQGQKVHDSEQGRDTWKKVGNTYLQIHEVIKSAKITPVASARGTKV